MIIIQPTTIFTLNMGEFTIYNLPYSISSHAHLLTFTPYKVVFRTTMNNLPPAVICLISVAFRIFKLNLEGYSMTVLFVRRSKVELYKIVKYKILAPVYKQY